MLSTLAKVSLAYFPVVFPLIMILLKCLAVSLHPGLFRSCLVPMDIAFAGFAFDVYAMNMISQGQWVWPGAREWLKTHGNGTRRRKLFHAEVIGVSIVFALHCVAFFGAIHVAPELGSVSRVIPATIGAGIASVFMPVLMVQGGFQRTCAE